MTLVLNYGNAVTGAQRFRRPKLEERFMTTLTSSAGVKMFGLRRIGKSTLRLFATEHFDNTGRPYAFIDGQGLHSLGDLLGRLSSAMPSERNLMQRALGFLSAGPANTALDALVKGTAYEEKTLSAYWRLVSDAIRDALEGDGPKPALVIDEFTYLIDNMINGDEKQGRHDADRLLASMREWRSGGMTMLLTGSIGLIALARQHDLKLEHLNDLQPFDVPELTLDEAREFIRQATETPSKGNWTNAHTEKFLHETEVFYPSFLVRGLLEIGVENPAAPEEFEDIFSERVRPDLHADFYRQFDRRFKQYAGLPRNEQKKLILPALKAVMEAMSPCLQDDLPCDDAFTREELGLALSMLVEDGFLRFTEKSGGRRFCKHASQLVRLWWKRSKLP